MPTYNKLVRDKIPQIIASRGATCSTRIMDDAEYEAELRTKLCEELNEYLEAADDGNAVEELADLLELIRALASVHGSTVEQLEAIRQEKAGKRGGFQERIFLIDVQDA